MPYYGAVCVNRIGKVRSIQSPRARRQAVGGSFAFDDVETRARSRIPQVAPPLVVPPPVQEIPMNGRANRLERPLRAGAINVDKRRSGILPEFGEVAVNEDISEIEGGPDRRRSGPPEKSYS